MLAIGAQRLRNLAHFGLNDYDFCAEPHPQHPFDRKEYFEKLRITLQKGNSEQIDYPDNYFDCYLSNMCLHITTHPEAMISEAYRVLQAGS
jgi:hypothetical protein